MNIMRPVDARPALNVGDNISPIPEQTSLFSPEGSVFPAQSPFTDLMFIRAQYPYIPVFPFPHRVVNLRLSPNSPYDMAIPEGATLCRLSANGEFYVSNKGNAELPDQKGNANLGNDLATNTAASLLNPDFGMFYVGGIKALSFISPSDGVIVCGAFWFTENWPRSDRS